MSIPSACGIKQILMEKFVIQGMNHFLHSALPLQTGNRGNDKLLFHRHPDPDRPFPFLSDVSDVVLMGSEDADHADIVNFPQRRKHLAVEIADLLRFPTDFLDFGTLPDIGGQDEIRSFQIPPSGEVPDVGYTKAFVEHKFFMWKRAEYLSEYVFKKPCEYVMTLENVYKMSQIIHNLCRKIIISDKNITSNKEKILSLFDEINESERVVLSNLLSDCKVQVNNNSL